MFGAWASEVGPQAGGLKQGLGCVVSHHPRRSESTSRGRFMSAPRTCKPPRSSATFRIAEIHFRENIGSRPGLRGRDGKSQLKPRLLSVGEGPDSTERQASFDVASGRFRLDA